MAAEKTSYVDSKLAGRNKSLLGAAVIAMLSVTSPVMHAVFIETFETETNGSLTFSEAGGPGFTVDNDLMVEEFGGLGSGGSDFWLRTGFGGANNGSGGSSGNVGSMTVDMGWSFVVNSFDAWTGQNDGNNFIAGNVLFTGTLLDNSTVTALLGINTINDTDFIMRLNFTGTARVIVKSGVKRIESGGCLVNLCHLDPIFEFDPAHYLRQVIETA